MLANELMSVKFRDFRSWFQACSNMSNESVATFGTVWCWCLCNMSNKYFWSLLKHVKSSELILGGRTQFSGSKSTIGSFSQFGSDFPIGMIMMIELENPCGPVVGPSRCFNGNSLAWSWHTNHCSGLFRATSSNLIMPPRILVFTAVPSQPTWPTAFIMFIALWSTFFSSSHFSPDKGIMKIIW